MVILGIDPGTAHTGYGVVLSHGTRLAALDGGVIETRAGVPLERRLADIHARVCDLIREHEPAALAVEDLYFGRNAHSAFAVGQARGVVLLSAGMAGIPVLLVHASGREAGGLRHRLGGEGPGAAHGGNAALAARSRRIPTMRRTPSPWPSATRTASP